MTEEEVVNLTCAWLKSQDWRVISCRYRTSKGIDIAAETESGQRLSVECKGSKSPRTGRDFSMNDCWRRAAGALFDAVRAIETGSDDSLVAIALPRSKNYSLLLENLRRFCGRNRLMVIWLDESGVMDLWQPEPNKLFKPIARKDRTPA